MNITLPDDWSEITLGQWQEMKTLPQDPTELERTLEVVSIILDKSDDEIGSLSEAEMNGIKRHLSWMNEPMPADPQFDITVCDTNLSLMTSVGDIESGAWADLERCVSDGAEENLHKILSILYRRYTVDQYGDKVLKLYESGEAKSRASQFKKLPIAVVNGASVFFLMAGFHSARLSLRSSSLD